MILPVLGAQMLDERIVQLADALVADEHKVIDVAEKGGDAKTAARIAGMWESINK